MAGENKVRYAWVANYMPYYVFSYLGDEGFGTSKEACMCLDVCRKALDKIGISLQFTFRRIVEDGVKYHLQV